MKGHQRAPLVSAGSSDTESRRFTHVVRLVLVAATILFCVMPNQSQARAVNILTYQEMLAKSDLVVIATPKRKTTDTREHAFFSDFVQDKDGKQIKVESIGVETVFVVSAVLKGDATIKKFTLHHYRENSGYVTVNGPMLVFFDPSKMLNAYLLFLIREPDGRFAPTGGQTDPGGKAISPLPFE